MLSAPVKREDPRPELRLAQPRDQPARGHASPPRRRPGAAHPRPALRSPRQLRKYEITKQVHVQIQIARHNAERRPQLSLLPLWERPGVRCAGPPLGLWNYKLRTTNYKLRTGSRCLRRGRTDHL